MKEFGEDREEKQTGEEVRENTNNYSKHKLENVIQLRNSSNEVRKTDIVAQCIHNQQEVALPFAGSFHTLIEDSYLLRCEMLL